VDRRPPKRRLLRDLGSESLRWREEVEAVEAVVVAVAGVVVVAGEDSEGG
jgi:hypothetical protein